MSTNPAETAGPNADGSKSLARESKFGQAVTFLGTAGAMLALDLLGGLDTRDAVPTWLQGTVTAAIATAVGLLTAYVTRNRTALSARLRERRGAGSF
jgi:hypothetical protein